MDWLRSFLTKRPYTNHIPLLQQNTEPPLLTATNGDSPGQQPAFRTRAQRLFHSLGISIVYHTYYEIRHSGRAVQELEKIAIKKDFWTACLVSSIHIVPIAAALVLVVLNWKGYYIGGELAGAVGQDDAKFIGLQFAAKLHELTISASLTAVIFSYIRHELVTASGLPFGAIVAGLQFHDISYLWSMEFWGAIRASWRRKRDKTALILLIITCAGLSVSAGPSSATLMRPRLDYWPAGGTDFWIALPQDGLYSTNASASQVPTSCMNDTGDLSCPSGGWQALAQDYMSFYQAIRRFGYLPDIVQVPGDRAIRALRGFHRSPNFQFSGSTTQATIGTSSVADALVETGRLWAFAVYNLRAKFHERFWSRLDVTYSVRAQQPIVHARCAAYNASTYTLGIKASESTMAVYDLSDQDHLNSQGDFGALVYNYTDNEPVRSLVQNVFNITIPQVAWATVPQSNGSALGATLVLPLLQNGSMLIQCTIAARMAPSTLQGTRNTPLIVTGADHSSIYDNNNTLPRISINPAWAAFLNPTIPSDNSTAFQYMMKAAGLWDNGTTINPADVEYVIESLLSLTVVNGLARRDFGTGFSGTLLGNTDGLDLVTDHDLNNEASYGLGCDDWCKQFLPSGGYAMGYGGNAFNISNSEKALSTKFTMQATAQGLAYSARGSAAKFAIFALLLYAVIAASHFMYTVWNKESSSSWDSISELVALAMRSDQSESFVNTGAGIDSSAIFKKLARVIDKDDRLQLAVGGPTGPPNMVEPNKYYG
ncbi:hypothetical protein OEA41_009778 [Lepraria neglecta]|uniref:Uncharacterized protein n=1 Tax=Lepraria neglecta TaxID=209136 RepID=A0AAD9YXS1_9LECA|nr:hypothetical protein OEA41_009778 [Lepraria neglecta]